MRDNTNPVSELLLCLGGPIIWAVHFFVMYGASTLACLNSSARHSTPFFVFAFSLTLVAIFAVLGLTAWQVARASHRETSGDQTDGRRFLRTISILLGSATLLAIAWATLPLLMLPSCSSQAV